MATVILKGIAHEAEEEEEEELEAENIGTESGNEEKGPEKMTREGRRVSLLLV
jgi:hypothetical protein